MKPSGPRVLFARIFFFFFITDFISLLVASLFPLSVSSWFNFDSLYVPRNLSVYCRLFSLLAYNFISFSYYFSLHLWYQLLFLLFLENIYLFGSVGSQLRHVGSFIVGHRL